MRVSFIVAAALTLALFGDAEAQPPLERRPGSERHEVLDRHAAIERDQEIPANVSPDMWAYLQEMRRQDDPKTLVRRAAQLKAEQRRARLASQAWYGVSNLRPIVNPTPFMGNYSATWAGTSYNDGGWTPAYYPATVYVEQPVVYAR